MNTLPVPRRFLVACVALGGHRPRAPRGPTARSPPGCRPRRRRRRAGAVGRRRHRRATVCGQDAAGLRPRPRRPVATGALLASWRTVAGCGAGASTGTGGGIKWVGRNVTGGLFQAQCQANYVQLDDGYNYVVNTLVNADLGDKWNIGVNIPWLYKYWRDPYGFGFDISNEGVGDTSVLLTRRFGAINATSLTLSVGIPTGGHKAENRTSILRQDKQMGHGKLHRRPRPRPHLRQPVGPRRRRRDRRLPRRHQRAARATAPPAPAPTPTPATCWAPSCPWPA